MKRKQAEIDEDGDISRVDGDGAQPVEAFVNQDLIEDFIDVYAPGTRYNFTHIFTRPQLRHMFSATIDFQTLDPLPAYLTELSHQGFKEKLSPSHEPCIYVIEKDIPFAIESDEDYD